jgi:acetyl-CoA carboxylase carboxyl transferase subunit beta
MGYRKKENHVSKETEIAQKIQTQQPDGQTRKVDVPEGLWMKCEKCGEMLYRKQFEENLSCCPKCGKHYRVSARVRVEQLADPDTFEELLSDIVSTDPLEFTDRMPYKERLVQTEKKSGMKEAMIVGRCYIKGRPVVLGVMDPNFIMGSMGAVVGEKVSYGAELAAEEDIPFIMVTCSGGARMMEGMVSLVQMSKTSAAIARLDDAGGLYIVVMTDPTTAGVAASFAFLGDVIIAEPETMIGFAGPRVIWNTVKAELPEGFQTAEFMLEHGFIDKIVDRKELRNEIARLIDYCGK